MMNNPFQPPPGTMHPRNVAVPQHPGMPMHATPSMLAAQHHAMPEAMPPGPQLQAMAPMAGAAGVMPGAAMQGRIANPFQRPAVGQGLRTLGSLFGG